MVVDKIALNSNANTKRCFAEVRNFPDRSQLFLEIGSQDQAGSGEEEVIDVDTGEQYFGI